MGSFASFLAAQGANADFTISTTSFQIIGPDITEPFSLSTTIPTDNVALETAEDFVLSLTGVNNAGMAILAATADGQFASPMIRVVIEDTESNLRYCLYTNLSLSHTNKSP